MHQQMATLFTAILNVLLHFAIQQAAGRAYDLHTDLDSNRDLTVSSKHAVTSFKTDYGDIFDCVDIYKQPAFNSPLLKNHTLKMMPSFIPEGSPSEDESIDIGLRGGGCPDGTVPIRKNLKKQVQSRTNLQLRSPVDHTNTQEEPGWHFAAYHDKRQKQYTGIQAIINIFNPKVFSESQHSHSIIWVSNGAQDAHNVIQAGWTVFPGQYGDNRTRLYTSWTRDNYKKTGCVDTTCAGFVQVSKVIPPGATIEPVSQYGGPQWQSKFIIFQDQSSKEWWLIQGKNVVIGYWPKELFTAQSSSAQTAGWGGQTYSPLNVPEKPQMGSGDFSGKGYRKACYFKWLQYLDVNLSVFDDAYKFDLDSIVDGPDCYDIAYNYELTRGSNFYFGGPGGNCGN